MALVEHPRLYAPCPNSNPLSENSDLQWSPPPYLQVQEESSLTRSWSKSDRVARTRTSSQAPVGWLAGNLCDSRIERCCYEERKRPLRKPTCPKQGSPVIHIACAPATSKGCGMSGEQEMGRESCDPRARQVHEARVSNKPCTARTAAAVLSRLRIKLI